MVGVVGLIWVTREQDSFFAQDWTGQISLKGLRNFLFSRNGRRTLNPHGEEALQRRLEPCGPASAIHPSRLRCAPPQDEVWQKFPARKMKICSSALHRAAPSGKNGTSP
jgi:hypothetical protein